MKTSRFPSAIYVVQDRPPNSDPYLRVAEAGIGDEEIMPGQRVAIYALTKVVRLKQKRWVE